MMDIRPIRTDADYNWAVQEIEQYFNNEPEPMTPEADRFDVLTALINAYDDAHHSISAPDPVEVIHLYMDQNGLKQADLGRVIGSQSRASEVLNKQRALSIAMITRIRAAWGVSADLLVSDEAPVSRRAPEYQAA